jgi:dTDP-4-amino-4,6-dideoxygalactose transaminase
MRRLRNHGVTREAELMGEPGSFAADGGPNPWAYEQLELGFNYRMNEMEAALGLSQLGKLDRFVSRRQALAARYDRLLARFGGKVRPVPTPPGQEPSPHLYTVLIDFEALGLDRAVLMRELVRKGIGTQVHYIPLYRQPYLRARYGETSLPGAEAYYARCLALPLFPAMAEAHVDQVVLALAEALGEL